MAEEWFASLPPPDAPAARGCWLAPLRYAAPTTTSPTHTTTLAAPSARSRTCQIGTNASAFDATCRKDLRQVLKRRRGAWRRPHPFATLRARACSAWLLAMPLPRIAAFLRGVPPAPCSRPPTSCEGDRGARLKSTAGRCPSASLDYIALIAAQARERNKEQGLGGFSDDAESSTY